MKTTRSNSNSSVLHSTLDTRHSTLRAQCEAFTRASSLSPRLQRGRYSHYPRLQTSGEAPSGEADCPRLQQRVRPPPRCPAPGPSPFRPHPAWPKSRGPHPSCRVASGYTRAAAWCLAGLRDAVGPSGAARMGAEQGWAPERGEATRRCRARLGSDPGRVTPGPAAPPHSLGLAHQACGKCSWTPSRSVFLGFLSLFP